DPPGTPRGRTRVDRHQHDSPRQPAGDTRPTGGGATPARRRAGIRERAYGPASDAAAEALGALGRALTELAEAAAARPMPEHALRIGAGFYGADHRLTASDLLRLADAVRSLDGPAAARPLLERALRIRATAFGPGHPWTATVAISLASVLSD